MATDKRLTGYNMKTKEKDVPMDEVVINKNGNRYFAKGVASTKDKTKMSAALGEAKALEAIKNKVAKKGEGWD